MNSNIKNNIIKSFSRVPRRASFGVVAQILAAVISLIQLKILTINFQPSDLGFYNTLSTFISFFQMIAFGPICNSMMRFISEKAEGDKFFKYFGSLNVSTFILFCTLSVPYALYLISIKKIDFNLLSILSVLIIVSVSLILSTVGLSYLLCSAQQKLLLKITAIDFIARPVILYTVIHFTNNSPIRAETVFILNSVVSATPYVFLIFKNKIPYQLFIERPAYWYKLIITKEYRPHFNYSLGFIPVSFLAFICMFSDRILAIRYLMPEDLAMIGVIQQTLCSPMQIVISVVFAALLPGIFALPQNENGISPFERNKVAILKTRKLAWIVGISSIPVLVFIKFFGSSYIALVSSKTYIPANNVMLFYAASAFLTALSQILSAEMLLLKKPHLNTIPRVMQLCTLLVSILFLNLKIDLSTVSVIFFVVSLAQFLSSMLTNVAIWKLKLNPRPLMDLFSL